MRLIPGFMPVCARSLRLAQELLDERAEDRDDLLGLVAVQDQRRQQTNDALGGDADEQSRVGRTAEQRRAWTVELDAEHEALAADLDDALDAGELALEARLQQRADLGGVGEQSLLHDDLQRLDAGA